MEFAVKRVDGLTRSLGLRGVKMELATFDQLEKLTHEKEDVGKKINESLDKLNQMARFKDELKLKEKRTRARKFLVCEGNIENKKAKVELEPDVIDIVDDILKIDKGMDAQENILKQYEHRMAVLKDMWLMTHRKLKTQEDDKLSYYAGR